MAPDTPVDLGHLLVITACSVLRKLCDLAAQDARRQFPTLQVRVQTDPTIVISGLPAGLRLAVDNAVSNAVRHGQARNVLISAHRRDDGWVTIGVDDDGRGIAPDERRAVFERFHRGEGAAKGQFGPGSCAGRAAPRLWS